jgi:ketosteroid isomerase-like protein
MQLFETEDDAMPVEFEQVRRGLRTFCGPQIVRKKFGRDRRSPTTPNDAENAFPQVRLCFSVSANDGRQQPKPRVIVPVQRLDRRGRGPAPKPAGYAPSVAAQSSAELVKSYVAAAQTARTTQADSDFEHLRSFLADDVTVRMASPWTDSPWRTVLTSADDLIARLHAPINQGSSLTTETVNLVEAGGEVLVEQISTVRRADQSHVSMVCHIFSVVGDRITAIRTYRNDLDIPAG